MGSFFEEPRKIEDNTNQQQVKKDAENTITPSVNETFKLETISREDSIKNQIELKLKIIILWDLLI